MDSIIRSLNDFAAFYGISRPRLTRIVEDALRDHSGVFALDGLGFFQARKPGPSSPMQIEKYYPTRHEQESITPLPLTGNSRAPRLASPDPASPDASPVRDSSRPASPDSPSAYELKLRLTQAKIDQLNQRNILEQARLREETVGYCSAVVQLILSGLRAELENLRLDPATAASIRLALSNVNDDLAAVIPDVIAGLPTERIELALSTRRAERIAAARASTPSPASTSSASSPAQIEDTAS